MSDVKLSLTADQARSFVSRFKQIDILHSQINELAQFLASGNDVKGFFVVRGIDDSDPQNPKLVIASAESGPATVANPKPSKKK